MDTPLPASPLVPIRERIGKLLDQLGQKPGWLAEKARLERSTLTRILQNKRQPTAETLAAIAPALGVTVEELVAGTDAEDRINGARRLIDRAHYDDAVRHFAEVEQKAGDLSRRLREAKEGEEAERKRREVEERAHRATHEELEKTRRSLEEARRAANHYEQDARKYRNSLDRQWLELADLKLQAEQLGEQMKKLGEHSKKQEQQADYSNVMTGIAAFCAAVAAAMSLKSYMKDEPSASGEARAPEKKTRARTPA